MRVYWEMNKSSTFHLTAYFREAENCKRVASPGSSNTQTRLLLSLARKFPHLKPALLSLLYLYPFEANIGIVLTYVLTNLTLVPTAVLQGAAVEILK